MNYNSKKFISTTVVTLVLVPAMTFAASMPSSTANLQTKRPHQQAITGTVSAVNGNSVTFTAKGALYTVDVTNAKLLQKFGSAMNLSDLQTGDEIQIRGIIANNTVTPISLRDISLQAKNAAFVGTVASVNPGSFVLQTARRGAVTINTNSSTVIKKNGQPAQYSDIIQGATVRASGVWDRSNTNAIASHVSIVARD